MLFLLLQYQNCCQDFSSDGHLVFGGTCQQFYDAFIAGGATALDAFFKGFNYGTTTQKKSTYVNDLKKCMLAYQNNGCSSNGAYVGTRSIKPRIYLYASSVTQEEYSLLAGKRLQCSLYDYQGRRRFIEWDGYFPTTLVNNRSLVFDNDVSDWYSDVCGLDIDEWYNDVEYNIGVDAYCTTGLFTFEGFDRQESNCNDLRSSETTQHALITINGESLSGEQSQVYDMYFQPSDSVSSGTLNDLGFMGLSSFKGVSCRFLDGNIRGDGIIKINGHIDGAYLSSDGAQVIDEDCILYQGVFEPCCDNPVSWSETITDVLDGIANGASFDTISTVLTLNITSVEWNGFLPLTNYCCDDVVCDDVDDFDVDYVLVSGGGTEGGGTEGGGTEGGGTEGGGSVDITCICEALENLNFILTDKLNLIKQSIEDKDFTITVEPSEVTVTNPVNNITVEPCSPIVTNPVNNITVEPSEVTVTNPVNNITVEPCSPIVTNPVNNITVEPCSPMVTNPVNNITVEPSSIDSLSLNQDDLINKLDELFKTTVQKADGTIEEQDITEVLKNKELSSYNDTVIEPVNYAYSGRAKVDEDY